MPNGFSLGVLQFQKDITKDATPQYKVEAYGALASLLVAHSPGVIKNQPDLSGHFKTVKIKRKQRIGPDDTRTTAECNNIDRIPYLEDTVVLDIYREYAFGITDETIAAFDEYASGKVNISGASPSLTLMWEFMDDLMVAANGLLQAIDRDLITKMAAAIGKNRATGNNTAQTINLPLDITKNPLQNGINKILRDFKLNNMMGKPIVVGSGLFDNWALQQPFQTGQNFSGIDTRIQLANFDFWRDENVGSLASDANRIMVYEKNAIQLVEYLKYVGFKAGPRPGASQFGTITLPMQVGDQLVPVAFDVQLKFNDCPTEMSVTGYNTPQTIDPGYQLIISKTAGLYTIPTDAYKASDPLTGNRGSLLYTLTNECDTCD